jgi:hypothetical protein
VIVNDDQPPNNDKIIVHYTSSVTQKPERMVVNNIKDRVILVDHIRKACGAPKGFCQLY